MNENIISIIHSLSLVAIGIGCGCAFKYNHALGVGLLIAELVYIWTG